VSQLIPGTIQVARPGRRRRARRGGALVVSLMVVVVVASFGAAFIRFTSAVTRRQAYSADVKRALNLAEAGLAEAAFAIAQGKSGNVGREELPASFGKGVFWVEATPRDDGRIALVSNGLCGTGRFSIAALMQRRANPVASLGVFSDASMLVGAGVLLDGYDSREGTYESQVDASTGTTGRGASVNSNGGVVLERLGRGPGAAAPTTVFGDARPGPEGTVTLDPGMMVTGCTTPRDERVPLPAVQAPTIRSDGELRAEASGAPLVLTGSLAYDGLRVSRGAHVVVRGPTELLVGAFVLERGAELEIDTTDGPVTIYCTERLRFRSGSTLSSTTRDPLETALLLHTPHDGPDDAGSQGERTIQLESSGEFFGFLYAPENALRLPAGLRVFGAVAASELVIEDGARITFDLAMTESSIGGAATPQMVSWWIMRLPDAEIVRQGQDPRAFLARRAVTPVRNYDAHLEQEIEIRYLDGTMTTRTYRGPVDLFDWSDVRSVISVDWSS